MTTNLTPNNFARMGRRKEKGEIGVYDNILVGWNCKHVQLSLSDKHDKM
jgi:hypothetical protein